MRRNLTQGRLSIASLKTGATWQGIGAPRNWKQPPAVSQWGNGIFSPVTTRTEFCPNLVSSEEHSLLVRPWAESPRSLCRTWDLPNCELQKNGCYPKQLAVWSFVIQNILVIQLIYLKCNFTHTSFLSQIWRYYHDLNPQITYLPFYSKLDTWRITIKSDIQYLQ